MGEALKVDLNSDVGESFGTWKMGLDEEVIPLISSANIACGYHGGDPHVMKRTVALCGRHGVGAGAHPGFPDLLGFGRRFLDATLEEIQDYVAYQVGAIQAFAKLEGVALQHVKPHGALYNLGVKRPEVFEAVAEVLGRLNRDLILVVMAGPHRERLEGITGRYGIRAAFEFFADRAYNPDGSLVSRREPGAVIHDPREAAQRVLTMVREGTVTARDGSVLNLKAQTICVHGDNPTALNLVRTIRTSLEEAGIVVAPMGTFL